MLSVGRVFLACVYLNSILPRYPYNPQDILVTPDHTSALAGWTQLRTLRLLGCGLLGPVFNTLQHLPHLQVKRLCSLVISNQAYQ